MPAENRVLDLSSDEVALMGRLGIAEARIREILAAEVDSTSEPKSEAPSPHPSGLSATEREILRRGALAAWTNRRPSIVGVKGRISKPSSKRVGRSYRPLTIPRLWPRGFVCHKHPW